MRSQTILAALEGESMQDPASELRRISLLRLSEKRFERLSERGFDHCNGRKGVSRGISASREVPFRPPPGLFGQSL